MLRGMLVKPASSPSIRYISDPRITTSVRTQTVNTSIFRRLAASARVSSVVSLIYTASFSTRNTRSTRSSRITVRYRAPGSSTPR